MEQLTSGATAIIVVVILFSIAWAVRRLHLWMLKMQAEIDLLYRTVTEHEQRLRALDHQNWDEHNVAFIADEWPIKKGGKR